MKKINSFTGEYRFLSNFWKCTIVYEGITYVSTEHAYQSAKTLDYHTRVTIAMLPTPSMAKRTGRAMLLRDDWLDVKETVMYELVRLKFFSDIGLAGLLLETGDAEIVGGNTWGDKFWGVYDGGGDNRLGNILARVRGELKIAEVKS